MTFHIKTTCISCGACYGVCTENAIYYGESNRYHIDSEKCISCACCLGSCSIDAIGYDKDSCDIINNSGGLINQVHILEEKCIGCSLCQKVCPAFAIEGELRKTYFIDPNLCIKCGRCYNKCKKNAIEISRVIIT